MLFILELQMLNWFYVNQPLNGFRRKVDEKLPDTPWRKVSLEEFEIPESAKELAKTLKAKPKRLPVKVWENL